MTTNIHTEVFNIATGEPMATPAITLEVSNLLTLHNLKEAKMQLQNAFLVARVEVSAENYKFAKQNMVALNKLKEAIEILIKDQIEIPENTLKQIKTEAKELGKLIDEERQFYKLGYEEVFGSEVKKRVKKLVCDEIKFFYEKERLEEDYRIITEEQINKLCIISNGAFPNDKEGQFEWIYLTPKCKKEILVLVQNCLQFKQQRINKIQTLELANLKASLDDFHKITFEDVKDFIDTLDFDNKLTTLIDRAFKKQNAIRLAEEKRIAEEKAKAEKEAYDNALKQAKEKAELEKKLAEEKAKVIILQKEREVLATNTGILIKKEEAERIVRYEVICSYEAEVEDKGGKEIDEIRAKHTQQGFKIVKFTKKL